MKTILVVAAFCVSGCALAPDLKITKISGTDSTGAVKFRMPMGALKPKVVITTDPQTGEQKAELQLERAFVPYGDTYSIAGQAGFFKRTTVTATVTDDRLLKTLAVETQDLLEERIKDIGGFAKTLIGFLAVGNDDQIEVARLKTFPKNFVITFEDDLKNNTFGNAKPLTDITGPNKAATPWAYSLKFDEASKTVVENPEIANLARKGIIVHPSCRRIYVTLVFKGQAAPAIPTKTYDFSEVIPDPTRLETLKMPAKGSANFSGCSVNITANSVVERDAISALNELANQVQAIKKAAEGGK